MIKTIQERLIDKGLERVPLDSQTLKEAIDDLIEKVNALTQP